MNFTDKENSEIPFLGDSEMARFIRSHEWESSAHGPPEKWPQALISALPICLDMSMPASICWGSDNIIFYNDAWMKLIGEKHPSDLGRPLREVYPDHWETIKPRFQHVYSTGESVRIDEEEYPFADQDTSNNRFFDHMLTPIRDTEGHVAGVFDIVHETTKITQAEEAAEKNEERYRRLYEYIDEGYCVFEMLFDDNGNPNDYRYLEINSTFEEQTGLKNVIGKRIREMIPNLEEHWFELYGKVALTGEPIRFEDHSEQMRRWFEVYAYRVGKPKERKVALIFKNITERKEAEQERERLLREIETERERLGEVFRQAPSFMCILRGPDHVFERANDLYVKLVGGREVIGKPVKEALPEAEEQGLPKILDNVYHTGESFSATDFRIMLKRKRGKPAEERYLDFVYQPLREPNGEINGIFVQGIDLTERKRVENKLRESEERFRTMVESATEYAIFTMDTKGCVNSWNSGAERLLGWSEDEIIGHHGAIIFVDDEEGDKAKADKEMRLAREHGSVNDERPHVKKDGSKFFAFGMLMTITNDKGDITGYVKILQDITGRKRREERDRFIIKLDDAIRPLNNPDEIIDTASKEIGEYLNVDRCAYGEIAADEDHFIITSTYIRNEMPDLPDKIHLSDFGDEALRLLQNNRTFVVDNANDDPRISAGDRANYKQANIQANITVPLHKAGRLVAGMTIHQKEPRQWAQDEVEIAKHVVNRCWESIERARLTRKLTDSEAHFRRSIQNAPIPVITHTEDGEVLQINNAWKELTGYSMEDAPVFLTWLSEAYGTDRSKFQETVKKIFKPDHKFWSDEFIIQTRSGERLIWNFCASSPGTLLDGRRFIVGMALDITERKKAENTQRLLLGELNHRVKNTLATIQAIASQTLRQEDNPSDFVESFNGRLKALAGAHSLLTKSSWEGAYIGEILRQQLALREAESDRIEYKGSPISLGPQAALHLALVLHELGTNARKHGALSPSGGHVTVKWKTETHQDQTIMKLVWTEQGGPKVKPPKKTGFGRLLIEQSLKGIGGETNLIFKESGLICKITLALSASKEKSSMNEEIVNGR